ncbi:Na+/H+ antiporter NhaA [Labilibaculum filiforme]|uniref:Na(+)/H(+) antiporter NhaA n=2 Tax=Labilibaculum filiforme TaxID=1940526 RepID=A0A2N3I0D5_9BACT|nr:Na+/H+ antiporter NhaA [Labilibaculum filiforme]
MIQFLKEKKIFDRIKDPLVEFMRMEAFGGIVLMFFTILAMVLTNSMFGESFLAYWKQHFGIHFGEWELSKTLIHWINDGLMAIFFFVVGLEIKREVLTGGLSSIKKASLPIFGAIGGMVVPALIYIAFNLSGSGTHGWGVPMATDIAFALGILLLLGKRIPTSLKLLLTSIAIVDDIGAVIVIALYYTNQIDWIYLLYGGGIYAILWGLNLLKVRKLPIFLFFGVLLWFTLLKSGVHATLAGILLAFTIPAHANRNVSEFIRSNTVLLKELGTTLLKDKKLKEKKIQSSITAVEGNCIEVISPLERLEHFFHPWVAYFIVPLFAFSNAGVILGGDVISNILNPISLGVILGLFLGKPIGIFLFSYLGVKMGFAQKPKKICWSQIIGIGFLGGIGFTMSFFVSQLAFSDPLILNQAKIAVLVASVMSGLLGFIILKMVSSKVEK